MSFCTMGKQRLDGMIPTEKTMGFRSLWRYGKEAEAMEGTTQLTCNSRFPI